MNFKAQNLFNINSADVDLNGITLIFGGARSGKSNLIRGMHYTYTIPNTKITNSDGTEPTITVDGSTVSNYLSYYEILNNFNLNEIPCYGQSKFAKENSTVISLMNGLVGGKFVRGTEMFFLPTLGGQVKGQVKLVQAGDSAMHLFELWTYLNYNSEYNDLIIMDCPERYLSLHDQRKLARLFATLANKSIKVCIATNSDIIAKEINMLIGMYARKDNLPKEISRSEYLDEMFLPYNMVTAYDFIHYKTVDNRRYYNTYPMTVDSTYGIDCSRFDTTIEDMNAIHESLIWS